MPRIFCILLTLLACTPSLMAQRAPKSAAADIAPYVFPQNRPATPPNFAYDHEGNGYFMLSDDGTTIDRYDIRSGKKVETVFDVNRTREHSVSRIEGFTVSDNGRFILVYKDSKPIYRRSFTAEYYVYECYSRLLKPLSYDFKRQRSPVMSPDGRMVAFVADDNNIYIKKNDYDSQVAVTRDGAVNSVLNGVPDWVYEEEFSTACSMVWSPDNLMLSYIRYDESQVPMYSLPLYEGTCDPMTQYALYPGEYSYKYPVAGVSNSRVSVHSYDVETRKTVDISLPDQRIEYVPSIAYGCSPERLMVSTLNRDQNHYEIYLANPRSSVVKSVYVDDSKAWIQEQSYTDIHFADSYFIVMSGRSGYSHLYKYSYTGGLLAPVTKGDFDVTACYGYDAKGNFYYQAAHPTPMDRVVYRIDPKGNVSAVSAPDGTNSAYFSPDMLYARFMHSDVDTPPVYTVNTADGKLLRTILDNAEYAARYRDLPRKEFFTMQSDGYTLNGYIIRPADTSRKAPVVVYQYSGPGSQQVLHRWEVDWMHCFAKMGYVIVCVDPRGTGGRGREFMDVVYKRLGYYESIDQVNVARYAASLPYADPANIAIFGWSYGGYETLMAASQPDAPFAAAVAVAPVTDWRFYDSIYTERYMLTPQQNESGYRQSSALERARNLRCPLLVMYGTADDNVHPANSLQYVSTLQSLDMVCDMFVFPNMNHSIYGCNARAVVYAKMLDFLSVRLRN